MHGLLHLHHHRHSGTLLHHRHTSYRSLFVVVVLAGLCMLATNRVALAADLQLNATVPAPIPSGAPVFTSPANNSVFEDPMVTLAGTCPVISPAVLVVVRDGASAMGSAPCLPDGTFSLDTTLNEGTGSLIATVTTITGDDGDSSTPLTLTYTPPVAPEPPLQQPAAPENLPTIVRTLTVPLDITAQSPFIVFGTGNEVSLELSFTGGQTPYLVTINWGDNSPETVETVSDNTVRRYEHLYGGETNYTITVKVTDFSGLTIERSYAAVNLSPVDDALRATPITPVAFGFLGNNGGSGTPTALYLSYVGVLLLLAVLWRYELLLHRPHLAKHPLHYPWQRPKHHA